MYLNLEIKSLVLLLSFLDSANIYLAIRLCFPGNFSFIPVTFFDRSFYVIGEFLLRSSDSLDRKIMFQLVGRLLVNCTGTA